MSKLQSSKEIVSIIEQKMLEFFGDPDNGLIVRKNIISSIKKQISNKKRNFLSHNDLLKKYGIS